MRYISLFTHEKKNNVPPTEAEMAAMGKLIEDGMKAGWLIATEGVQFGREGVRVEKRRAATSSSPTARSPRPRRSSAVTRFCGRARRPRSSSCAGSS